MVWYGFIVEAKSKNCSWVPSVPSPSIPPWKKSSLVFIKPSIKAKVQISVWLFSPYQSLAQYSLYPHLATLASVPGFTSLLYPGLHLESVQPSNPRQLLGPHSCCGERTCKQRGWAHVTEQGRVRKRASLLSLGCIISGLGRTRHSFNLTNQFPNTSWTGAGSSP